MGRISALLLSLVLLVAGCSGGDAGGFVGSSSPAGAPPLVLDVRPTGDPPGRATVGPDGGTVEVATSDASTWTLEIPPLALLEPVEIALTPVAVANLPVSGPVLGGLQMSPSGLHFLRPARLTLRPGRGFRPEAFLPIGSHDDGTWPTLLLGAGFPDRVEFSILHFSNAAAAEGTSQDAANLGSQPAAGGLQQLQNDIGQLAAQAALSGQGFTLETRQAAEAHLRDYFLAVVKPALEQAHTDEALESALQTLATWQALVIETDFFLLVADAPPLNPLERRQGRHLVIQGLREAVDRVNERTRQQQDWQLATGVLHWNQLAQALGVDQPEEGDPPGLSLDLDAIADRLAVRVIVGEFEVPATLDGPFDSFEVRARAWPAVVDPAGQPVREFQDLPITVEGNVIGAAPEDFVGETNPGNDNRFVQALNLAAHATHAAGEVVFTFPPVQVPIRTVRPVRTDGPVMLDWTAPDEMDPGDTTTVSVRVRKGRGLLRGRTLHLDKDGGGSLSPEGGTTDGNAVFAASFTAPAEPGTTVLTARYVDVDHPRQPQYLQSHSIAVASAPNGVTGSYSGTHTGLTFPENPPGPSGRMNVQIYTDQLHASFYDANNRRIYIFEGTDGYTLSGNTVQATGRVYYCDTCFGFPGTFTATLAADGVSLSGSSSRDGGTIQFSATRTGPAE